MSTYQAVFQRKEVKYLLSDAQLAALMPILSPEDANRAAGGA